MIKRILSLIILFSALINAQDYKGVENCQMCHQSSLRTYPGFSSWQATLHAKIHELPSVQNMKGNYSDTVKMGSSYGNAYVVFRIDGSNYFVKLVPATGSPVEYQIAYTYGGGWKQRYLVKIENSYYMPPVQWDLAKYKDNTSGRWVSYNPQNWFDASGNLKPIDNTFRKKSWDKNCAGCHVVPGSKVGNITKTVTGSDTAWVYTWGNSNSHANIVVGCESCHGATTGFAGAGHANPLTGLSYDRKIEVCGKCHMRGTSSGGTYEYPYDEVNNKNYEPGENLSGYAVNKPGLWPDGKSAKQHHQQFHDFKLSSHYNPSMGLMTCVTCHDPHQETAQKHQLKEDFNALQAGVGCGKCHSGQLAETNGINNHSKHPQSISQCVNCHMTHNAKTARDYDISNHSFMPIRPNATRNFSTVSGGMINTCAIACHRNGSGTRGGGPSFGITDASLTNWAENTDVALADTLWKYYQTMYGVSGIAQDKTDVPSEFALYQNYPNPFNPATLIQFSVPKRAEVRIEVYSIDGSLVNVLVNNQLDAGVYKVDWNGMTASGYNLPSGVYIYRMIADNQPLFSKKMVLVR